MDRQFYLDLAAGGLRMPVGTDLVMHQGNEPERVRNDGAALGRVIERAARRWGTPLAIPLMDLRLEKMDLAAMAGVPVTEAEAFHFTAPLTKAELDALCGVQTVELCAGSRARDEALAYIKTIPDLVAVGMAIGPFSLTTRLMADPISVAALAGSGVEEDESDEVKLLWQCLRMAETAVLRSVRSQIVHGARAVMICEPTACTAFISPRQMKAGSDIFERLVMEPNLRLKAVLDEAGCDLIFHDCGELIDPMVEAFANRIHPKMLSLGSSRKLWEDARLCRRTWCFSAIFRRSRFTPTARCLSTRWFIALTSWWPTWQPAGILLSWVRSATSCLFPRPQDTIWRKVDAMMSRAAVAPMRISGCRGLKRTMTNTVRTYSTLAIPSASGLLYGVSPHPLTCGHGLTIGAEAKSSPKSTLPCRP